MFAQFFLFKIDYTRNIAESRHIRITIRLSLLTAPSGQIRSAWEWYCTIKLSCTWTATIYNLTLLIPLLNFQKNSELMPPNTGIYLFNWQLQGRLAGVGNPF